MRRDSQREGWDLALAKGTAVAYVLNEPSDTLGWTDPASETICVVFTSLPARAVQPHPHELASATRR